MAEDGDRRFELSDSLQAAGEWHEDVDVQRVPRVGRLAGCASRKVTDSRSPFRSREAAEAP